MENALPLKLKNVEYYLIPGVFSNSYSWAGDFILTSEVLYYFPVRDLVKEKKQQPQIGGLLGIIIGEVLNFRNAKKSYFDNLFNRDDTDESLKARLDDYLLRKKNDPESISLTYSIDDPPSHLPGPIRMESADISDIVLSKTKLSFKTVADTHDFRFNKKETERVKQALVAAKFRYDGNES